jgi:hypothetical protein
MSFFKKGCSMCFSAQASFTASALLALIGIAALMKARHQRPLLLFATIPFLFSIQQLCEGIIWMTDSTSPAGFAHSVATHMYLIFAYLIWPLWMPLSILALEGARWRRFACYTALCVALCFSMFTITQMVQTGFWARIDHSHISYPYYGSNFNFSLASFLYLYATGIPLLASHMRYTWLLAAAVCGSLAFTTHWYHAHVTSIWCFFAAILSALIFLVVSTEVNKNRARKK